MKSFHSRFWQWKSIKISKLYPARGKFFSERQWATRKNWLAHLMPHARGGKKHCACCLCSLRRNLKGKATLGVVATPAANQHSAFESWGCQCSAILAAKRVSWRESIQWKSRLSSEAPAFRQAPTDQDARVFTISQQIVFRAEIRAQCALRPYSASFILAASVTSFWKTLALGKAAVVVKCTRVSVLCPICAWDNGPAVEQCPQNPCPRVQEPAGRTCRRVQGQIGQWRPLHLGSGYLWTPWNPLSGWILQGKKLCSFLTPSELLIIIVSYIFSNSAAYYNSIALSIFKNFFVEFEKLINGVHSIMSTLMLLNQSALCTSYLI